MLTLAVSLRMLRFSELMEVYSETNSKEAENRFGDPAGFGLQQVEQDFRAYLQHVFFRTKGAVYALWEYSGRYVCALRLEPYRDGLLISALETHPGFRRRGYACSLITQIQNAFPQGTKLYSHVEKRNIPSMRVHEQTGFQCISNQAVYLDGSVDSRCSTLFYEI